MKSPEKAISALRRQLGREGHNPASLDYHLNLRGQKSLENRKFVGIDRDYGRVMIYRVNSYDQNEGIPLLHISELTVPPQARTTDFISLSLHRRDIDVTRINLELVAKALGLSTEHFHHYV